MSYSNLLGPFLTLPMNFQIRLFFQPEDGGRRFIQGDRVSVRQHGRSQHRQIILQMSEEYKIRISLISICLIIKDLLKHQRENQRARF